VRQHLGFCIQLWAVWYTKGTGIPWHVQWRAIKIVMGLKHLICSESRDLGLFSLEMRGQRGELITATALEAVQRVEPGSSRRCIGVA